MRSKAAGSSRTRRNTGTEQAEARQSVSGLPRLLVAGSDGQRVTMVAQALEGLRVRLETLSWEDALEALAGELAGLVLVLPIQRAAMTAAVEIVRDHPDGKAVPLCTVVPDRTSSRQIRKLYAAGANVVLEWPREAAVFRDLFAESFGITRIRGNASEADRALARSVRAHLRIYPELDPGRLHLHAQHGLITISGQTRSLTQREGIIDIIAAVPGVRAVMAQSLRVTPVGVSDRKLRNTIQNLLRTDSNLDSSIVSVRVRNGHVQLSGTLGAQSEVQRLERLVTHLKGVRGLEMHLRVSPALRRADRQLVLRYRKALETLYPNESVSLNVIGGAAILSGTVGSLSTKRSMVKLFARDGAIHRVVNKLEVQ